MKRTKRVCPDLTRELANLQTIVQETNLPSETVQRVIETLIERGKKRQRKPRAPAPVGGISLREASRKYKIPHSTIWNWVNTKVVDIVQEQSNWLFISDSQVAKLAANYKPGRGRKPRNTQN